MKVQYNRTWAWHTVKIVSPKDFHCCDLAMQCPAIGPDCLSRIGVSDNYS
jgi:hypothetical protein